MGLKIVGTIERVNGKELSYSEFVERFMAKNQPVILTGLMDHWRACKDWVLHNGKPNLNFFASNFGNSRVQVAECSTREFTDQKRTEMSVSEFIGHWLELSPKDYDDASTNKLDGRLLLYLKDWHFVKEYPEYSAYTTPLIFRDDWLNQYLDQYSMREDPDNLKTNQISCSDYRFVYMGAKGTWTPFHADVFRSYSWSANVCGKKQWYFLSPGQHHLAFDRIMKNPVYDIFEDVSETRFPDFKKASWLECTQDPNEIIFVPSGWYHQVHNLEDTISINHNWFNAFNLSWVWDLLLRDYNEAKEYIEDIKDICDDFEGLCQRNLAANTGMNFYDFFIFIVRVSFANLVQLSQLRTSNACISWSSCPRVRHIYFNLESARIIALKMKSMDLTEKHSMSIFLDLRVMFEDPTFLELCTHLEVTYATIYEQCKVNNGVKKDLVDILVNIGLSEISSSLVCTPEDLISLIDRACELELTAEESLC